jgi:hypothetical protein
MRKKNHKIRNKIIFEDVFSQCNFNPFISMWVAKFVKEFSGPHTFGFNTILIEA